MKRSILITSVLSLIATAAIYVSWNRGKTLPSAEAATPAAKPIATKGNLIAAPGRVEPASEEINVGAEVSGKLRSVLVEEGDYVVRGQVIATLENSDYKARLASAEAQLAHRKAELERLQNGARREERLEAAAAIKEAEAIVNNAQSQLLRRQKLHQDGDISREEMERAERELQVAKAKYQAVVQRHAFVDAKARHEDVAKAQADIRLAEANLAEARAMLEKTMIRAPLSGTILRKHLKPGETVIGSMGATSMTLVTMADTSVLRVRVDVDETDVAKLQTGQKAFVKADAYGDKQFHGSVFRIGEILGKKNIRTDEPSEKVDTKILEVLLELEPNSQLKPGLRVDAFISTQ
jgi:ABC exporter DevB family membrane fusion protein